MNASQVSVARVENAHPDRASAEQKTVAWVHRFFATEASWPLTVVRVVLAVVMFAHGAQKVLGLFGGYGFAGTMGFFTGTLGIPYILGLLAISAEFAGSIALLAGFAGRLAAAGIGAVMLVAVFTVHVANGFFMNWYGQQPGEGFEYHLLAGAMALAVAIGGSGNLSVDRLIAGRIRGRTPTSLTKNAGRAGIGAVALTIALGATGSPARAADQGDDAVRIARNLATFDDLDYNVFTNQKWSELHRSHSHDITVYWPDGHSTQGIEKHIQDLQAMFVWAPDTRIKEHPVKIGQGEWTAVIGIMEGTFTKPMPLPDGTTIPPTGKAYRIRMATIGHWNDDGVMDAEYLFWDNQEFMKEIGLGK